MLASKVCLSMSVTGLGATVFKYFNVWVLYTYDYDDTSQSHSSYIQPNVCCCVMLVSVMLVP